MKKISIILPVYKVEEYIDRCLDSLVNQTYKNLEIILVDDGSPDNSGAKCDEWAKKDKRIKVIHKENGGVSSARNVGLDNATGDYIGFVDPDDFIDHTMYEKLYNKIVEENADISMCKFYNYYDNGEKIKINEQNLINVTIYNFAKFAICSQIYSSEGEVVTDNIMGSLWRSLFKKDIIEKLRFRTLKVCEDLSFYLDLLSYQPKFTVVNEYLYYYYVRDNSAIRLVTSQSVDNRIEFIGLLDELLGDKLDKDSLNGYKFHNYASTAILIVNSKDKKLKKYYLSLDIVKQLNTRANYKAKQKQTKSIKDKLINFLMHYKLFGLYRLLRKLKGK